MQYLSAGLEEKRTGGERRGEEKRREEAGQRRGEQGKRGTDVVLMFSSPILSNTRHSPWPKIENYIRELPPGRLIADVGTLFCPSPSPFSVSLSSLSVTFSVP